MISKEELLKKFKERQLKKHGGESNYSKALEKSKNSILNFKGTNMGNNPSDKHKVEHQKRIGRAYSE